MSASPVPTAQAAAAASPKSSPAPENPSSVLGQNDFLKLMIAQLQSQDPLQPANTNEYVSELAQFTQVEQTTNLANASELSGAVALIGRTVSYTNTSGEKATGAVQAVQSTASGTTVTIEGVPGVKLSSITEVH
jgi:flagellar basal-body rod modification protein FlgD